SRLAGYGRSPIPISEQDELEMLAFGEPQMEAAVRAWFGGERGSEATAASVWAHLKALDEVRSELRCPLLLRLSCQVVDDALRAHRALPRWERRGELYSAFLQDAVMKWAERADKKPGREACSLLLPFAGDLALELWKRDARRTLWDPGDVAN